MSRSIPLWTSSKNQAIHHCRVVDASSRKTSDTNAVYTKEERYIKNRIQSATAEQKYMEGCNTFPRSRRNMSRYSASYIQIQIGYDRSLWAKAKTQPRNDAMIVDEPVKPVAGSSKHPNNTDVIDGELIY